MKLSVKLIQSEPYDEDGYPISLKISHQNKRPYKWIGRAWPEHFSDEAQMVTDAHPDYDILAPKIMDYKAKGKRLILQAKIMDPEIVLQEILKVDINASKITLEGYYKTLIGQMTTIAEQHRKRGDIKAYNKIQGNVKVYENAMAQFTASIPGATLEGLDHPTLLRFKNYQLGIGNKKNTVHLYLRTIRAIYNKGVLFHKLSNPKPFTGLFTGLATKSYSNKKKYITKESIRLLESASLAPERQKYIDLFLLQFYFGGSDLKDVYYLEKKQIRKGRVYFERGKVDTGLMIDLKIHPKAMVIINKYPSADNWLFPWRKDETGYEGFRRRHGRALIKLQEDLAAAVEHTGNKEAVIEVLPTGGNLAIKVARHTFANIAKRLGIEDDLLRELMGHQRDGVDNFYKDLFPQALRDEALFKIID